MGTLMSLQESKESTTTTMHHSNTSGCYMVDLFIRWSSVPHLKQLLLTLNTELEYKTIFIEAAIKKKRLSHNKDVVRRSN